MNIILVCVIVSFSITYIIDYVSFPRNFLARIYSMIFGREILPDEVKLPYVLQCSLCATTWATLAILLVFNFKLCWLCLLFGWATSYELQIMTLIDLFLNKILALTYKLIEKIK